MQARNIRELLDNPLAGCEDQVRKSNCFKVLENKLYQLLQLTTGKKRALKIYEHLYNEKSLLKIDPREFIVNELQYEIRITTLGERLVSPDNFETVLINSWFKIISKRNGEDAALDLVTHLKRSRKERLLL